MAANIAEKASSRSSPVLMFFAKRVLSSVMTKSTPARRPSVSIVPSGVIIGPHLQNNLATKQFANRNLRQGSIVPQIRDFHPVVLLLLALCAFLTAPEPAHAYLDDHDDGGFPQLSFGFKAGLAIAQHQGTEPRDSEYAVASSMRRGGAAGVFWVLPVTRRFGIQQEVIYVQKGSRQDIGVDIFDVSTQLDVTYELDYLEIPVMMRYHWVIDRQVDFYSLAGFAFGLKLRDSYRLSGEVDDGVDVVPITADNDMSEVDIFDFVFTYGLGLEFPVGTQRFLFEYRFDLSVEALMLPTYAYVPFGEEQLLVDNDPVPLRNQSHMLMVGLRF